MRIPKLPILALALALALLGWTAVATARAGSPETPPGGESATSETKGAGQEEAPVVDEMPVPVRTVPPAYPESARKRKAEGTVLVQARVAKSGKVDRIKIAKDKGVAPDLDKAAVDAVRQWEFKPAQLDGKPVVSWVVVPIVFKLK